MRLKLAVWLMVLVVALDVSAQTPRVVRDGAGQPRAGAATLTFGIYAEAESGAPLWTEVQGVTLDSQGRYAVTLGALEPEGLPLALFTSGAPATSACSPGPRTSATRSCSSRGRASV